MRNSSPIIAPESRPKKSAARSPKSPSPSGRVKRWVTRNALFHLGRRRPVGRLISVKSGCDRFRTASSRSSSAGTGAGVAVAWGAGDAGAVWALATEPQVKAASTSAVERWRVTVGAPGVVVVRRAELDPALDHENLSVGQRRAVERHAGARNPGPAFELVDDVAVLGIAGGHALQGGLLDRGHADEAGVGVALRQVHDARQEPSGAGVTADAPLREDLALDARQRRLQVRRRAGEIGELLIAPAHGEGGRRR